MSLRALIGFALGALLALILAPSALGVTIANGDIIVNNTLNGQVLRVDPATGTTTPIVTISSFPIQGIAVEADGKILVCGRGTGGGPGDFAKVIRIDPVTGTTSGPPRGISSRSRSMWTSRPTGRCSGGHRDGRQGDSDRPGQRRADSHRRDSSRPGARNTVRAPRHRRGGQRRAPGRQPQHA